MIELKKISYGYKGRKLFDGLDLSIAKGAYVSIAGLNGSGKTSLGRLLKGFFVPFSGQIFFENKDVTMQGLNSRIAYISSNPENQLVSSVVSEDIAFGPENQGYSEREIQEKVFNAAIKSEIDQLLSALSHQLSGGQQQRVAIAGILAMETDCIIFDEAASMIDPVGKRRILGLLEKINKDEGVTLIHISHKVEDILKTSRVLVLKEGRVLFDGAPADLLSFPNITSYLGWEQESPVSFIRNLLEKKLLARMQILDPEAIAESLASES